MACSLLTALSLSLGACGNPRSEAADGPVAAVPTLPPADYSLYDLDSRWTDQAGNERSLESLKGQPVLLSLVYTNCASICPMTVSAMQRVESNSGGSARFVLVSLDPQRDSPQRLAEFARLHGLSSRWTLLSGTETNVRELTALLRVQYRRVGPGEIDHAATLTVLDSDGRLVAQFDKADAVERATEVLQDLGPNNP